jgi:hypothetical protein
VKTSAELAMPVPGRVRIFKHMKASMTCLQIEAAEGRIFALARDPGYQTGSRRGVIDTISTTMKMKMTLCCDPLHG